MPVAPVLPPHPDLPQYGRDAGRKRAFLRDAFDETAGDYDRVERLLALGSGRWYRRQALTRAGLTAGTAAVDVACGTGLVSREILRLGATAVGVDPSVGMIGRARDALGIPAVLGVAEALPLATGAYEFLSMGYALRHVADLHAAFGEFARVLRPGGRVCVLEIVRPEGRFAQKLMAGYFRGVLPALAWVAGGRRQTRELWKYYWETINHCVPGGVVVDALAAAGFADVRRRTELGLFAEYTGTRA